MIKTALFSNILIIEASFASYILPGLTEDLFQFLVLAHLGGEHQVADTATEVGAREALRPGDKEDQMMGVELSSSLSIEREQT